MSEKPSDPAAEQSAGRPYDETYSGQQGHDVEYEEGRYRSENMQQTPEQGRSGSYETSNRGGYGTGQADADGQRHSAESPTVPADPEAQQGQGGQ